jgi:hypothetical protein
MELADEINNLRIKIFQIHYQKPKYIKFKSILKIFNVYY